MPKFICQRLKEIYWSHPWEIILSLNNLKHLVPGASSSSKSSGESLSAFAYISMVYHQNDNLCSPISDGLRHLLRLWLDWHTSGSVAASLILQIILLICGIYRKRSSSKVVKALGWFSYMAADAVAIYALGLMLGSACRTVYAVWAPLVLFHLGGPDNFTAYSDADTQLWPRHALTMVFQICVNSVIVFSSGREGFFSSVFC
eukprot:Gb_03612 [translate_table: standard]